MVIKLSSRGTRLLETSWARLLVRHEREDGPLPVGTGFGVWFKKLRALLSELPCVSSQDLDSTVSDKES
jgi:hypothetical protein